MAKQCPRCWEKVDSDVTICPHCDYNFNRKAAAPEDGADVSINETSRLARKSRKDYSSEDGTNYIFAFINFAVFAWAVIAVLGGIWNIVSGEVLQGAGLLASGIIASAAAVFMHRRQYPGVCWILVLISGAATLQIPTLVVGVLMAFLVYMCKPYFGSTE